MNIIVHYPKKQEDIEELRKKVATVHTEAVIRYIDKLNCPKEQKIALIDVIKKGLQQR